MKIYLDQIIYNKIFKDIENEFNDYYENPYNYFFKKYKLLKNDILNIKKVDDVNDYSSSRLMYMIYEKKFDIYEYDYNKLYEKYDGFRPIDRLGDILIGFRLKSGNEGTIFIEKLNIYMKLTKDNPFNFALNNKYIIPLISLIFNDINIKCEGDITLVYGIIDEYYKNYMLKYNARFEINNIKYVINYGIIKSVDINKNKYKILVLEEDKEFSIDNAYIYYKNHFELPLMKLRWQYELEKKIIMTKIIEEELMMNVWHPKRVEKLLNLGCDINDL